MSNFEGYLLDCSYDMKAYYGMSCITVTYYISSLFSILIIGAD